MLPGVTNPGVPESGGHCTWFPLEAEPPWAWGTVPCCLFKKHFHGSSALRITCRGGFIVPLLGGDACLGPQSVACLVWVSFFGITLQSGKGVVSAGVMEDWVGAALGMGWQVGTGIGTLETGATCGSEDARHEGSQSC